MSRRLPKGTVVVNDYSSRWLRRGFGWVYDKEIEQGQVLPGAWTTVQDRKGRVLGHGLADAGWIAVRVLRHDGERTDRDWLFSLLDRAATLRERLIGPDTTGYRLVHAEADGLPGVHVDWWDHYAVVVLDSPSLAPLLPAIDAWLHDRLSPRGVYCCYRPDPRDERDFAAVEPAPHWVSGRPPTGPVVVRERGIQFRVYPGEGPDVGLYPDMRDVRAWLEPCWGGQTVLNTFAYTGAFSVAAAMAGASQITSVDLSARYLERAEDNFRANGLDPLLHDFVAEDTFKALDRFRRKGRRFDRILLDPPSFSHGPAGRWSAKQDYARLVAAAARAASEQAWILTACNLGELSPKAFRGMVLSGFKKAGRRAQEIWIGSQSGDHPGATWAPEARYLKVSVWRLWD